MNHPPQTARRRRSAHSAQGRREGESGASGGAVVMVVSASKGAVLFHKSGPYQSCPLGANLTCLRVPPPKTPHHPGPLLPPPPNPPHREKREGNTKRPRMPSPSPGAGEGVRG